MDRRLKIVSLLFVILALRSWGGVAFAEKAKLYASSDAHTNHTAFPDRETNWFAIHPLPEYGIQTVSRLSESIHHEDKKDLYFEGYTAGFGLERRAVCYLSFSKIIAYSLRIKKLLFPFHAFS